MRHFAKRRNYAVFQIYSKLHQMNDFLKGIYFLPKILRLED